MCILKPLSSTSQYKCSYFLIGSAYQREYIETKRAMPSTFIFYTFNKFRLFSFYNLQFHFVIFQ